MKPSCVNESIGEPMFPHERCHKTVDKQDFDHETTHKQCLEAVVDSTMLQLVVEHIDLASTIDCIVTLGIETQIVERLSSSILI